AGRGALFMVLVPWPIVAAICHLLRLSLSQSAVQFSDPALPHRAISNRCWRRLTMSHSARSHSSHSDVPGSKLATSQVAGTRKLSYGTTVTCAALPHCGAARNSASTKASSSVLVFGSLSIIVFFLAYEISPGV